MLSIKFLFFYVGLIASVESSNNLIGLSFTPYSLTSVVVRWNNNDLHSNNITIQHRFSGERISVNETTVRSDTGNFTLNNLQSRVLYQFRAALQDGNSTGRFSTWKTVRLDVSTYLLRVQQPSETKSLFKQKLYEVFPLSFLSSKDLNSTRIDLDTSMVEVFYEVYFSLDVNITSRQLTEMFARNYARVQTTFVRNVRAFPMEFCKAKRSSCSRFANCTETPGSYTCQCKDGYIDVNTNSYQFSGRKCSKNTGKPGSLTLKAINPTTILLNFNAPRSILGNIRFYQVQYSTLSDASSSVHNFELRKKGSLLEKRVTDLPAYGLHQFRARAVTNFAAGLWTKWTKVRTNLQRYELTYIFVLQKPTTNYQQIKKQIEKEVDEKTFSAIGSSRSIGTTDIELVSTDQLSSPDIRVKAYIYTPINKRADLKRMQRSARFRLRNRFPSILGRVEDDSAIIKDVNECQERIDDCGGNACVNEMGKFSCSCPAGVVDVSDDFNLLPGRKCIVFDAPVSFSLSLLNPTTVNLNWKIPTQMRKPELLIWFIVQYKLRSDENIEEEIVTTSDKNFFDDKYVFSWVVKNLKMSSIYLFRAAVSNTDNTGRFTEWKSIQTNSLIFVAKLNLTRIVFSKELQNRNHDRAIKTSKMVKTLISRVMTKLPKFTEAGNVTFTPGLKDRTYANVYLFFNNNGNVNSRRIQEMFQHNSVFDVKLGLDFQTVNVTDLDECKTPWNDCAENATCTNKSPGFSCACNEDHVDLSRDPRRLPGRVCLHQNLITTPQPSATPMGKVTRKRKKILPFPGVSLIGYAAGLRKIRLKWRRLREGNIGGLNYDIQYRVKGLPEWKNVTISSQTQSLDIENLYKGALYEIRAAERKAQNSEPDTLFTIPIEIRTVPQAYRMFLQLPEIPATSTMLSSSSNPQKTIVSGYISDYLTDLFNHPNVLNKYRSLKFGSVGKPSFSKHPDKGVIVSAILYLSQNSQANSNILRSAYEEGERLTSKSIPINFMYISDLDECSTSDLNDCSPTGQCFNLIGSFDCKCWSGYLDKGPDYHLLPGRYCITTNVTRRLQTLATLSTTTLRSISTSKTLTTTTKETFLSRKSPTVIPFNPRTSSRSPSGASALLKPVNKIGLLSGTCLKGQKMIRSFCQDVSLYLGEITVVKESGRNISSSNLLGNGKVSLREAVETALDTAFSDISNLEEFYKAKVQQLSVVNKKIRALFVIIMSSNTIRFRRQIEFILNDIEKIRPNAIKKYLWSYLNENFPRGNVKPLSGAEITFGIDDLLITDLNECETFQSMRNCDTVYGKCRNTEGGFECECKNGSVDVSSDVRNRPGRQCRDQCNPSPCLNNGECISQQHVGPPSCFCGKSYSGLICEEVIEEGTNLLVIALSSIAGVLFIFFLGFIAACYKNRKNKKREKREAQFKKFDKQSNWETTQDDSEMSTAEEQNEIVSGEPSTSPGVTAVANQGETTTSNFHSKPTKPPPIPPRASLKHKGLNLNFQNNSGSGKNSISTSTPFAVNNQTQLSPGTESVQTTREKVLPKNIKQVKNTKQKIGAAKSAIRGRIRRHSDESI